MTKNQKHVSDPMTHPNVGDMIDEIVKKIETAVADEPYEPTGPVLHALLLCVGNMLSCAHPDNRREACKHALATLQKHVGEILGS
jgi:hypothetical protein